MIMPMGNMGIMRLSTLISNSEMAEHIIKGQYTFPGENPTVDTNKAIAALKADSTQASEEGAAVKPLGGIVDSGTAGKQENPYIYLGKKYR